MKLVIATLREQHEINRGGGGEKDTQKKIQNDENKYDQQTASILSCKL